MNANEGPKEVDFAIVTALPLEREAIVARLEGVVRVSNPDDPYTFHIGTIPLGDKSSYTAVVVQLLEMGNLEAAASATSVLGRWKPKHVLMLGIAAGIGKNGVRIGDVVVASSVYYYEPGKSKEGGEERRPRTFVVDRVLYGKALNYEAAEWKDNINVPPPGTRSGFVPKAHFGPIASGEKVIADQGTIDQLVSEVPKLVGVAMEGAGVAQAAENNQCGFLEIRGASDLGDKKKKDNKWRPFAAHAAAAFAIGFLKSKPVSPREELSNAARRNGVNPPLLVVRAQAQRHIRPDEILPTLSAQLRTRDIQSIAVDLTPDVEPGGGLRNPEDVVARLLAPNGEITKLLERRSEAEFIFHGHVHIPIAALLGFLFTDRQPVGLFDYHPTASPPSWNWPLPKDSAYPDVQALGEIPGAPLKRGDIVLRMGVSYSVQPESTRAVVANPVLELDLQVPQSERGVVKNERQVLAYGAAFRKLLDRVASVVIDPRARIHLFYAGPVSLAFHMGQLISASIHPPVVVWNYSRQYDWAIDLGAAATGEIRIVRPNITKVGDR
jgi:nucleoside phosphorylase